MRRLRFVLSAMAALSSGGASSSSGRASRFSPTARALRISIIACAAMSAQHSVAQEITPVGPAELAFSTENMDRSVSPKEDFYRYAVGTWLDSVRRPDDKPAVNVFSFMTDHVQEEMTDVIKAAAANAGTATPGSPEQQVGDFYNAYMDTANLDALGIAPLQPELDRIAAIGSLDELSSYIGRFILTSGEVVFGGIVPSADRADSNKIAMYFVAGDLGLLLGDVYEEADGGPRIEAYRKFVSDTLQVAGDSEGIATDTAALVIAIERQLHAGQITPVEAVDPRATYNPMAFADLQAQVPELNLTALLGGFGAPLSDTVVLTEPRYLASLSQVLREHSLDDLKTYLRFRAILKFSAFLTTAFDAPQLEISRALAGVTALPPREQKVQGLLIKNLGQPLSQLYVEAYFEPEARQKGADMIGRIKDVFLERMAANDWLSPSTKAEALDKLQRLIFRVGYPEQWIDYSGVTVVPDNAMQNISNLTAFDTGREIAKIGKPVIADQFNNSAATLPIVVNAAYSPQINGFEVPAAILQPGMFDPAQPAAVNFCRLGAVLGHEMTHGFDSGGRFFDAAGNLRDWWTPGDSEAFQTRAQKLIDQADAYEVMPGLKANGKLEVTENMADLGGITFARQALMKYLSEHPDENVEVGGLTQEQLCFVAWAQMWATSATDQYFGMLVARDNHAPGPYRAIAALQHLDAFYDAFGIVEGDPMWLPPEKRAHVW